MGTKKKTKEESEALIEKTEHPERKVICPRCRKEIEFINVGTSAIIKCKTEGCIETALRGI